MHSVNIKSITAVMSKALDQEGVVDPDLLGGVHMVLDEITLEAIEEGAVDPDAIDPKLSDLYDAYESYKEQPSLCKLKQFEVTLGAVGEEIDTMASSWVAYALGSALKTADEWVVEHPRYAEGIYAAVTLIAQKGAFGKAIADQAKSLMLGVEELEEGRVDEQRLVLESTQLAALLKAA